MMNGNSNGNINGAPPTNGTTVSLSSHCIANNNNIANNNITASARNAPASAQQQIPLKAISWNYNTDFWWDKVMAEASVECEPVWVDAEDPLFILYTR